MTSVNTKKGGVDFKWEEGMNYIHEEDEEELDDSSFALRDRSVESQPQFDEGFIAPDEDPDISIYFTSP